jgi:replication factor C subunit 3/5
LPNTTAAIMSDYEDEMDVDPKPSTDAIQFGTDKSSGKTKRLTADLPVEAADNLPW